MKSHTRTLLMAPATTSLASRNWNSAANRQSMTTCTTSGWTLVVLISQITMSSRRLSIPCFDGIKTQSGAMPTCQTCQSTRETGLNTWIGSRRSATVDGSREDGHYKSCLLLVLWSFIRETVSDLVIKNRLSIRSVRLLGSARTHSEDVRCPSSASRNACVGAKGARQRKKKTRRTVF
jgi:hypothetical protein